MALLENSGNPPEDSKQFYSKIMGAKPVSLKAQEFGYVTRTRLFWGTAGGKDMAGNAPTLLPGCAAGKARAATEGARLIGQLDLDTVEPVMILQRTFADWTCSATQPTA